MPRRLITRSLLVAVIAVTAPFALLANNVPLVAARLISVAPSETLAVFSDRAGFETRTTARADQPVVVLVAGMFGSAFSMRHVTRELSAAGTPTVVVDLLGMGASSHPERANYSLAEQSRRLGVVLDSLHIARAVLVGHGIAATIALHLAASEPARVAGVLSLSGGPVDQQSTKGVSTALRFASLLDNAIGRALARRRFLSALRDQSVNDAWCTSDVAHEYLEPYERDMRGALRAIKRMNESVEPAMIGSELPGVTATVRMLVGDKVSPSTPTDAQVHLLVTSLRDFRIDTVRNAGIMLHEEQPSAVVAAVLALVREAK